MTLSIITAQRGREDRIDDFVSHYLSYYPEAEIIIGYQDDDKKFKKGQLFNILSSYAKNEFLAFIDIDIRLFCRIELVKEMNKIKRPFLPYDKIERCNFIEEGKYEKVPGSVHWLRTPGGFLFFTKTQYLSINGHSNLYDGYGYEDADMMLRAKYNRIDHIIMHLEHPVTIESQDNIAINKNIKIYNNFKRRDIMLDGTRQTIAIINNEVEEGKNVKKIYISNIGVSNDFIYKGLL